MEKKGKQVVWFLLKESGRLRHTSHLVDTITDELQQSETPVTLQDNWPETYSSTNMSHMLVSLLSLFGEGFEGSLAAALPLAEAATSAPATTATTERLVCSSARGSGLGWAGGGCSAGGWAVSSCCSLWLCIRRSCTRSSKMASCSSWMAWFRWVFLFYKEITQSQSTIMFCFIMLRSIFSNNILRNSTMWDILRLKI